MSFLMQNAATAIGASRPIRSNSRFNNHMVETVLSGTSGPISACTVKLQGGNEQIETCVNTSPVLVAGTSTEKVGNSAFYYQINGTNYAIGANSIGTILTTVGGTAVTQTVTASKYAGLVFVAGTAGTIRCITPSISPTGVQAYNSPALVNAALDLIEIPSEWCYIGRVVVTDAGAGTTFGTTAFTDIGVFSSAYCPFNTLYTHDFSESGVSAQREIFTVNNEHADFIRTYISTFTGTGKATVRYTPASG
jgi:hypothetical protein